MEKQKAIRLFGIGIMLFSLMFMSYKYFKDTAGNDISYISIGLLLTVIGMGIASYGSNKQK